MPFPAQKITGFTNLRNYINTYIIPNGLEEIDGTDHNNVENALLDMVIAAPLNNSKALVVSSITNYGLVSGVTIFTVTPTSLTWGDNVQNEWIIINRSISDIPLLSGTTYLDSSGNSKTSIAAGTVVHIVKMVNGNWIQIDDNDGGGGGGGTNSYTGNLDS